MSSFIRNGIAGLLLISFPLLYAQQVSKATVITDQGKQPRLAIAQDGKIHLVFGLDNKVYHSLSVDNGESYSEPHVILSSEHMHLGWRNGPQIIAVNKQLVVSLVAEDNNLQIWNSGDDGATWNGPVYSNERRGTLPEGFHSIAAGKGDQVFAVWLELQEKGLNIRSARSVDGGKNWDKNRDIYTSPDGTVCECCRPSVAADGAGNVGIMWRNSLDGNRDMYMVVSTDEGQSFSVAKKLGAESWKLDGCPVDGGSILVDRNGNIHNVWRRENTLYVSGPGQPEMAIGEGMHAELVQGVDGSVIAWQQNQNLMLLSPAAEKPLQIGEGAFVSLASSPDHTLIVMAYQQNSGIAVRTIATN